MALSYMRRHRRWLYGLLWLVIAAFIVFYIPAFLDMGEGQMNAVARVGQRTITMEEFRSRFDQMRLRFQSLYQREMDMRTAKQQGLPEYALQSLVEEILVQEEARRLGVVVEDAAVKTAITTSPEFQRDGKFIGGAEFQRIHELQGISQETTIARVRSGLLRERLESLVTGGVDVTPAEVEREYRRRNEQLRVEYVLADSARFRAQVMPSADDVRARFEAQRESYRFPERRVLSYVVLSEEAQAREVAVTEREITIYYEDHERDYSQPEQACASHILVKVKAGPEDAQGHEDAQARAIAEGLLAQVKKGANLAALAKKSSEDAGSAPNGGDLGCFGRGQMVPEFDQAVFALSPGQTSDLVKSSFGYHIIRLASRQEPQRKPIEQVRPQIEQILRLLAAQERLEEKAAAFARALRSGDSLDKVAQAQALAVQKTEPLARGAAAPPLVPAAVSAAFNLKAGEAQGEPFAGPTGVVFVAVAAIEGTRLPELKEVEERVRQDLVDAGCQAKALELARQVSARARSEGLERAARALGLTRKETPQLVGRGLPLGELGANALLEQAVFGLEPKKISEAVRVAAGYAVVGLIEKKGFDAAAFEKEKAALVESQRTSARQRFFRAFLAQAAERYKVERTDAFRTALGSTQ